MAQRAVHLAQYATFRADAERPELSPNLRVEAWFLAAYHRIDASAARVGVHIGKHQNIRRELELNAEIFGMDTHEVWQSFQELETRIRPKFVYGQAWSKKDVGLAKELFERIERLCSAHDEP